MRAIALVLVAGCASAGHVSRRAPAQAYREGVEFLVSRQNPDGSFSHGGGTHGWDVPMGSPESFRAFKVACTALCVMALRGPAKSDPRIAAARERAIEWLVAHGKTNRALPGELYNVWTHAYVVHALSEERSPRLGPTIEWNIRMMERYETMWGGWQYYDSLGSQHPALEPTSFTTATGLVALAEARQAGAAVPDRMVRRALQVVEQCRMPDGRFCYDWGAIPRPQADINKPKGNISRSQPCNLALALWDGAVTDAQMRRDLELMFREHKWMDVARKRPIPHEGWYAHAGYFYYYAHMYAARNIVRLGESGRLGPMMLDAVLPHQEADGSWWDFPDYTYDKFYGTAQALLAIEAFVR